MKSANFVAMGRNNWAKPEIKEQKGGKEPR